MMLQLINSRSAELDHLVEEMTEYYSQPENRELHAVKEVSSLNIYSNTFINTNCNLEFKILLVAYRNKHNTKL
jgi:hypothetical protein